MTPRGGSRANSGRPLKYGEPTRRVSLALPLAAIEALDRVAEELGVSRTEAVVRLIERRADR